MKIKNPLAKLFEKAKAKFGSHNVERTEQPKEPKKSMSYQHQKILNEFLRTIGACPMDPELKTVLRMRVWGIKPTVFDPMTHQQIAMHLNTRVANVKRWEEDAIWNVEQFLKKTDIGDVTQRFIKDGHIKDIIVPRRRIIG